jgi:voltage-gated potassium channel
MTRPSTAQATGLVAAYVRNRHAVLFYSLLLTLVASPLLAMFEVRGVVLQAVLAFNLVACVLGLAPGPGRSILIALTPPIVVASLAPTSLVDAAWSSVAFGFWALIALFAAVESVRFVMSARSIHSDHVYAALGVYLLVGVFFGVAHSTIEQEWPGSYLTVNRPDAPFLLSDAIYFSFVTLATLGYGDVVPAGALARGFAVVEAVGGQLYLAALVARLVGAWIQPGRER